jgi:hypothetical protein
MPLARLRLQKHVSRYGRKGQASLRKPFDAVEV